MLSWINRVNFLILPQIFKHSNANGGVKTCKLTFKNVKHLHDAAQGQFLLTMDRFINLFGLTCDALHDLLPLVRFKKREKHPWNSVTYSKGAEA